MLRKMFLFGLGAMQASREEARKFFDEMVQKGEMSSDEAKKYFDDIMKDWEENQQQFKDFVTREMEKICSRMGLVTKSELEALKKRLDELEQRIGGSNQETSTTTNE